MVEVMDSPSLLTGTYCDPAELYSLLTELSHEDSGLALEGVLDAGVDRLSLPSSQADKLADFRVLHDGTVYDIRYSLENTHVAEDGGGCAVQSTILRRNGAAVLIARSHAFYTTLVDGSEDYAVGRPRQETRVVENDALVSAIIARLARKG